MGRRGDAFEWLPLDWQPGLSLRRDANGAVVGRFFAAELTSVYQPVVALEGESGMRRVGREALVRSHAGGGAGLSPWGLFSMVADDDALVGLDRLCRTLHTLNDPLAEARDECLFLNVHGRLLAAVTEDHGRAFRRILDLLGRPSINVVIETPESACADPQLLAFVLSNYRLNGFKVAVNVNSVGELEKLFGELRPNFVKIDSRRLRREEFAAFAELAAAHGALPVFTRVERAELRAEVAALDGAWAQGYALDGDPRVAIRGGGVLPA